MAYCTQSDIEKTLAPKRLAELTDDVNGLVTDATVLTEQIAFADALIDAFLRGKHTVPLSIVPPMVRKWSVVLTIQNCFERRTELHIPETFTVTIDRVTKEMMDVRDQALMISDEGSSANTGAIYISNKTAESKIFTSNDQQTGLADQYFSKSRITPC